MSLYLDYRPQDFDNIVNQKHIIDILRQQIKLENINSNYLFFGPR
jgi:DNA polymerase III gamma/tau subunit